MKKTIERISQFKTNEKLFLNKLVLDLSKCVPPPKLVQFKSRQIIVAF
jgi:hypothetical protein